LAYFLKLKLNLDQFLSIEFLSCKLDGGKFIYFHFIYLFLSGLEMILYIIIYLLFSSVNYYPDSFNSKGLEKIIDQLQGELTKLQGVLYSIPDIPGSAPKVIYKKKYKKINNFYIYIYIYIYCKKIK
jgi:hypothetical protein